MVLLTKVRKQIRMSLKPWRDLEKFEKYETFLVLSNQIFPVIFNGALKL